MEECLRISLGTQGLVVPFRLVVTASGKQSQNLIHGGKLLEIRRGGFRADAQITRVRFSARLRLGKTPQLPACRAGDQGRPVVDSQRRPQSFDHW